MKANTFPWKGRLVAVLGAGRSGQAAARLLVNQGGRVLLSDAQRPAAPIHLAGVDLEVGGHSDKVLEAALIIRSPGIPDGLPVLQQARRKRIPIWSEIELASQLIRPRRLIAITGTNGKTTTTTLVGELCKRVDRSTVVAGNIGIALADAVPRIQTKTSVVLEVSSYQLENIETFHPTVSAILNITPDHLEHHGTMSRYAKAKARIFENQTSRDTCVLNADDPWCRRLAKACTARVLFFSRRKKLTRGVYFSDGAICIAEGKRLRRLALEWQLPGAHNVENALAAVAIGIAAKLPLPAIQRGLRAFKGVEHRLEIVRTFRDVRYVNDSKATNVDSTRVALESFDQPLIVIMGGQGKGSPYTVLSQLIKDHVRHLLLIGEDADRIERELGATVPYDKVMNMQGAVQRAVEIARPGETVLLSPACASFDQYGNYEERGRHFKELVRQLT